LLDKEKDEMLSKC